MFTAEQISTAHSKVKSGADFPAYIREIKALGVKRYEAYVEDGHIDYHGIDGLTETLPAKYEQLSIADTSDVELFKNELKSHLEGKTDFLTFIKMCATVGIAKWQICLDEMTCAYYDKNGKALLVENILR